MIQLQRPDRQKDKWKDGLTLFNRTLPATVGGPKSAYHLKYSNISIPMSIMFAVNHSEI